MRWLRVEWLHDSDDDPVMLYAELDDDRYEVRKVEVYRDGSCGWADVDEEAGGSRLGDQITPPLDEIAASPEFAPVEITRDEFESVWRGRRSRPHVGDGLCRPT